MPLGYAAANGHGAGVQQLLAEDAGVEAEHNLADTIKAMPPRKNASNPAGPYCHG